MTLLTVVCFYAKILSEAQRYLLFWPSHDYVSPQAAELPQFAENVLPMSDGTAVMT